MARVIMKELKDIKKRFETPRKTLIENGAEAVYEEKPKEILDITLLMDRFGYVRTMDAAVYERNKEAAVSESKYIKSCKNIDRILAFTDSGQMHIAKSDKIPYGKFRDKGVPFDNVSNYDSSVESIISLDTIEDIVGKKVVFVTATGMIKAVDGNEFDVSKRTTAATKLGADDKLIFAGVMGDNDTIVLRSEKDYLLRLPASEFPEKKKAALGVRGMKLGTGDKIIEAYMLNGEETPVLTIKDKEIAINRLRIGTRDTKGVKK